MMVDQKSLITVLIIGGCLLIGLFLATLKKTDRLTLREISALGFFRGLTMWSAVIAYLVAISSAVLAFAIRVGLVRPDDMVAMLGQPFAIQFESASLVYMALLSFALASAAMLAMVVIAIEMHLRRIANAQDRSGYFNN